MHSLNKPLLLLASSLLLAACGGSTPAASSSAAASSQATSSAPASSSEGASSEAISSEEESSEATSSEEESSEVVTSSEEEISSEEESSSESELEKLKAKYGDFSLSYDETAEGCSVNYDEATNTYTIAVAPSKIEYTLTGYFDGSIVISNVNALAEDGYKGAKLTLSGACLASQDGDSPISYTAEKKNVEISAKKSTENLILAYGSSDAISSENNIEIGGKGSLGIEAKEGHAVKAKGDISVYSAPTLDLTAAKDGFHGHNFYADDGEDEPSYYSGAMTIHDCADAIEATTDEFDGLANLGGGTYTMNNVENVFRTDVSLTIATDVTVTASNVSGAGLAAQKKATTAPTLVNNGAFTIDGEPYVAE